MKRISNLFQKVCDISNLRLADQKASKGKSKQYGVKMHQQNSEQNLYRLQTMLLDKEYKTSDYSTFVIKDPKERVIYRLPYFPDRITHHAVMNIMEPIFVSTFTSDTYSCIKGRGIHLAAKKLQLALKNSTQTQFCLKLDIRKFYPSIDHQILKSLIRRKVKDKDLLWLMDEIIDSVDGLPIGNYLSQYFANFYLSYFDHWVKQSLKVKYYFRYADDLVILSDSKEHLHYILHSIIAYLDINLKLEVKSNYQIFPVESRGIDFVGYVFFHTHTLLRKRIKKNLIKAVLNNCEKSTVASYYGWLKHCDSKNLRKKITTMKSFSDLGILAPKKGFEGDKIKIDRIINREIIVEGFKIEKSKYEEKGNGKCLYIQINVDQRKHVVFTGSGNLMEILKKVPESEFPFKATIVKENERLEFR